MLVAIAALPLTLGKCERSQTPQNSNCTNASTPLPPTRPPTEALWSQPLGGFRSNLPMMIIRTDGLSVASDFKIRADATVFSVDPVLGYATFESNSSRKERSIGIRIDASTAAWPKKKYLFETWDTSGRSKTVTFTSSIAGAAADLTGSNWQLDPMYLDESLVRAPFMFATASAMGIGTGAQLVEVFFVEGLVRSAPAELVLASDYLGVYMLSCAIDAKWMRARYPDPVPSASTDGFDYILSTVNDQDDPTPSDVYFSEPMVYTSGWRLRLDSPRRAPQFNAATRR